MCHELRNPLHVLKSTVHMLLEPDDSGGSHNATYHSDPHSDGARGLAEADWHKFGTSASSAMVVSASTAPSALHSAQAPERLDVVPQPRNSNSGNSVGWVRHVSTSSATGIPSGLLPGAAYQSMSGVGHGIGGHGDDTLDTTSTSAVAVAQRREMAADVISAIERMEGTVNDVLDFRKLDANMFVLTRKPTPLLDLIDRVCRHCRSFLRADVAFGYRVRVGDPSEEVLMLDARRVFQIITNGLR